MNFNEYQDKATRTAQTVLTGPQELCNYSLGLTGEAGEVADIIKKVIFHGHEMERHEVAKELGDVMWYVSQLARLTGFTLEQIAEMNIKKLEKRYSKGFSEEASINREL
ncbi:MazG nucleotide pyrophosphohydrolase domain protein [Bacillus phage vB_BhaS-171]|uniref:MazG-like pyrophosphatase n=1 Tax=Bacillus phage vB_BhaS-171 TaxID=1775140 RepID=UPI0007449B7A|nr:MazG-like pyrophosphatase [Bacillus phage vB_BhaS-171]ALY08118.1 MazG nucleotide pyrophosphohydrolase domain protein [Bacillus phage vB_BhaS-171]